MTAKKSTTLHYTTLPECAIPKMRTQNSHLTHPQSFWRNPRPYLHVVLAEELPTGPPPAPPRQGLPRRDLRRGAVDARAAAPLLHVAGDDVLALLVRVAGDPDAQLPEQPRRMHRGGDPRGAASLVFSGGRSLCAAGLGLLVLGSGTALLGIGGEVEVGAHDVRDAGCRVVRWVLC